MLGPQGGGHASGPQQVCAEQARLLLLHAHGGPRPLGPTCLSPRAEVTRLSIRTHRKQPVWVSSRKSKGWKQDSKGWKKAIWETPQYIKSEAWHARNPA